MHSRKVSWMYRLLRSFGYLSFTVSRKLAISQTHTYVSLHRHQFRSLGAFLMIWPFTLGIKPTLEEESRRLMGEAVNFIRLREFDAADRTLHKILIQLSDAAQANQISATEHSGRRARVFSEMANLRLMQLNYGEAEKLFVESIRQAIAGGMDPKDPTIVELSFKLAMIYAKFDNIQKAETGFKFCYDTQLATTKLAEPNDDIDAVNNNLALLGMVSNTYAQLKEACEMLQVALKCAQKVYPPDHENCLHLLADMASVESRLDDRVTAQGHLDEAVRLAETAAAHIPLVRLYCAGAVIEANRGEFVLASQWLEKAEKACSLIAGTQKKERVKAQHEVRRVRDLITSWEVDDREEVEDVQKTCH